MTTEYRYAPRLTKNIEQLEDNNIREAYTSLKVVHLEMKHTYGLCRKKVHQLNRDLEDYKERYNHLIKYLNTNNLV